MDRKAPYIFEKLDYGDNICFLFEDISDYHFIISNIIKFGLEQNDRVLYHNCEYSWNLLKKDLKSKKIDVDKFIDSGQFIILDSFYYKKGHSFDFDKEDDNWRENTRKLIKGNYNGFRFINDIAFAINSNHKIINRLMRSFSTMEEVYRSLNANVLSISIFNKAKFPLYFLEDMVEKHNVVISDRNIYKPNAFYLEPKITLPRDIRKNELKKKFSLENEIVDNQIENKHLNILRNIFRTTGDAVLEIDINNNTIEISDEFYNLTGFSPYDYKFDFEKLHNHIEKDEIRRMTNEFCKMQKGETHSFEFKTKFLAKDKQWIGILIKAIPLEIDSNTKEITKVVGTVSDISHSKLYDFKDYENNIETINYNSFWSNLSHELRTPLAVILGSLQLQEYFIEQGVYDIENYKKHLETVRKNGYRLLRLLNNVIDINKIDTNFFKLHLENYPIDYIVKDLLDSIQDLIRKSNLKLNFKSNSNHIVIACDPDKIERILLNLLSNAIKFSKDNGNILVELNEETEKIIIKVKDEGVGIPKGKVDDIFGRFVQVVSPSSRNKQGSGIGLSLVYEMVKLHNGDIKVVSEENVGTEFIISLPNKKIETTEEIIIQNRQFNLEQIDIELSDLD